MATSSCRPREGKEAKRRRWRKKRAAFEEAPRLADAKRLGIGRCDGVCGLHLRATDKKDFEEVLPSPRGVRIASNTKTMNTTVTVVAVPARGADCIGCTLAMVLIYHSCRPREGCGLHLE